MRDELEATYATAEDVLAWATEVRAHLIRAYESMQELQGLSDAFQWPSLRELKPMIEGMDTRIGHLRKVMELCRRTPQAGRNGRG